MPSNRPQRGPGSVTIDHHLTALAAEQQGIRQTVELMSKRRISGAGVVMLFGLLLPTSSATAKEAKVARKVPAVLVEVEGKLLAFQQEHTECTYKPGASIHGLFESPPQARFTIIGPKVYADRTFDVVFKCAMGKGILAVMESRRDQVFSLVLPRDFLKNADPRIEDCTIGRKGMARWLFQDRDERLPKVSLPASATEQSVAPPDRSPAAPAHR